MKRILEGLGSFNGGMQYGVKKMVMSIFNYTGIETSTRARTSNVATIVCGSVHGMLTGEVATLSGLSGTGYNDSDVTVTVTNSTTFTYSNTGSDEGTTGDTGGLVFSGFIWPYNPQAFDDTTDSNYQITQIGFQRHHVLVSGGGISPKSIILTGHFSGASKMAYWRNCSKQFMDNTKIKRLFFESDKFHLGVGKQVKRTQVGGRTNFVDYVATFESFIPVLFGSTERTSGTNEGNAKTFVISITGSVTSGASDITISDGEGNEITIAAALLTTGHSFEYKLVEMVDSGSGIFVSEYAYVELNGTQTKGVQTTDGFGILQIGVGASVSTITISNITSAVVKFRDGYYD